MPKQSQWHSLGEFVRIWKDWLPTDDPTMPPPAPAECSWKKGKAISDPAFDVKLAEESSSQPNLEILLKVTEGLRENIVYIDKELCDQLGVYERIDEGIILTDQIQALHLIRA